MKEIIEILSKRIQLAVIVIGLITFFIAAIGIVPIPNNNLPIPPFWRIPIAIIGIALLLEGIIGVWFYIYQELSLTKRNQHKFKFSSSVKKMEELAEQIIETITCEGTLVDLYLGNSEKVIEMPKERRWIYELQDVLIKIYQNELSLEYKALVKSPYSSSTEVYKCYGSGPFIDGVAHLMYSYHEEKTGSPNWKGVMVLRVPRRGSIIGYWLTTNVIEDKKFPMGIINLKRKI